MSRPNDPYDPCAGEPNGESGCARPPLERLRFWNGRFMVARDLRHQQDDLIRRLEYHQHFAHGDGILCGFRVRRHPRDDCDRDWLVVDGGMAYDCCGRTLWMPEPRAVRIPRLPASPRSAAPGEEEDGGHGYYAQAEVRAPEADDDGPVHDVAYGEPYGADPGQGNGPGGQGPEASPNPGGGPDEVPGGSAGGPGGPGHGPGEEAYPPDPEWFIVAQRRDRPTDPMPALYADDPGQPVRQEHGRVREDVELRAVPADEVPQGCWPRRRPVTDEDCTRDLDDDCENERGDTVPCGLGCACGDRVVVAAVWRDPAGRLRWDLRHRKVLIPPSGLTRITGVNWPHGGEIALRRLADTLDGRLVVRFSRRLRPAEGFRRGISPMTFQVSYVGQSGAWEQVMPPEEEDPGPSTPSLSPNGRCAVFQIPRPLLTGRYSLGGSWVRVRVLGDFLLDCHGRPVSAAHTGGDVNGRGSGNGVPGGTFESWFYVRNSWKEEDR
jgi:hypothetical protein